MKSATSHAFSEVDSRFDEVYEKLAELDLDQLVTVVRPPNCNCVNCRKRRQLETN